MTRRERLAAKAGKRAEWADKARGRSDSALASADSMASGIPFGQPILVGHHSEGRDRRYRARIASKMDRAVAEHKLAAHHASKASGLELQLERSIFSDDEDAIEQLEAKAKKCDDNAAECNAINTAWRKGGREAIAARWGEEMARTAEKLCGQFSWLARKGPMDASHDRAEARRCRERIKQIRVQLERKATAAKSGGVAIEGSDAWVSITFEEKPAYSVIAVLKAAGFRWGAGSWHGARAKLPEAVTDLVASVEEQRKADAGECLCSEVDGYECVPCEQERQAV